MKTGKIAFLGILTALALVISLFEQAIPLPFFVPGAKPGLSNIIILTCIVVFGWKEGFIVAVLKSVLLMLFTGAITSFFYSLSGAVLSAIIMGLAVKFLMPTFSLIGISEMGAFAHNFGQLCVASLAFSNFRIFSYMPVLNLFGLVTGFFVGLSCNYIVPHLKVLVLKNDN